MDSREREKEREREREREKVEGNFIHGKSFISHSKIE